MDILQLKCVLAVARYKSFSEASFELYLSQSTVSKKIASLEKELGVELFNRTTRTISLTKAGEEFVLHGEKLLSIYNTMNHNIKEMSQLEEHHLIIGKIYFAPNSIIIKEIANFAKDHQNIMIETIDSTTSPLIEALLGSIIDVAFVSSMYSIPLSADEKALNFSHDDRFISHSISIDPYFVVVNSKHHLANRECLNYSDLKNENMDVYHDAINKAFHSEGISPTFSLRCGSITDALSLISEHIGIGIFSKKVILDTSNFVLLPLNRPLVRDTQILIRNEKNISYPIKTFFNFFKNYSIHDIS